MYTNLRRKILAATEKGKTGGGKTEKSEN